MLSIYPVYLQLIRDLKPVVAQIRLHDRNLANQIDDASNSGVLNLAEGSGARAGRRRNAYNISLSETRETLAGLELAEAHGFIRAIDAAMRAKFNHIIGTLVRNVF